MIQKEEGEAEEEEKIGRKTEDNDDDDGSSRVPFIEKLATKEKNATSFMKSKTSLANE